MASITLSTSSDIISSIDAMLVFNCSMVVATISTESSAGRCDHPVRDLAGQQEWLPVSREGVLSALPRPVGQPGPDL